MMTSPTQEVKQLAFPDAIRLLTEGATITRLEWNDESVYCRLRDTIMMLYRDEQWFSWLVNDGDLLATDWIVLD